MPSADNVRANSGGYTRTGAQSARENFVAGSVQGADEQLLALLKTSQFAVQNHGLTAHLGQMPRQLLEWFANQVRMCVDCVIRLRQQLRCSVTQVLEGLPVGTPRLLLVNAFLRLYFSEEGLNGELTWHQDGIG